METWDNESRVRGKKAKGCGVGNEAKESNFIVVFDILSSEILKFLDNNVDLETLAALHTISRKFKGCLLETFKTGRKIKEVKSQYHALTDYSECDDCAIIEAASDGKIDHVKILLLQNGMDVNISDDEDHTALYEASRRGYISIVSLLLGHPGININQGDDVGNTPLHMAASNGHTKIVEMLLNRSDVDVNRHDILYRTPLHKAADKGHSKIVKILLDHPNIEIDQESNGWTPLKFARKKGHSTIVNLLLEKGASEGSIHTSSSDEEDSDEDYMPFA